MLFESKKVFPKVQKLTASPASLARQDTIDETTEDSKSLRRKTLEKQKSERDGSKLEKAASFERENASIRSAPSFDAYDGAMREQMGIVQRDLIATVHDIKVESKLEMQRMNQRIAHLEELIVEVLKRLPNAESSSSSPADDNIPTITTTFVGTPTSTNSAVQSPSALPNISSTVNIPSTSMSITSSAISSSPGNSHQNHRRTN